MTAPVTCRGLVYPWQCDHMGHMNVMWYVGKFDEATWQFLTLAGFTPSYLRTQRCGAVAVDQRVAYRREAHAGDLFSVRSAALEVGRSSLRFVHEMRNDETHELLATMLLTGVHIDLDSRTSRALPDELRRGVEARLAPDPRLWAEWPPSRAYLEE